MGRNTYESIGKLLPQRTNHIISTTYTDKNITDNEKNSSQEYQLFHTLEEWFERYNKNKDKKIYILGGGQIYKAFLPFADQLEITLVHADIPGDTTFPVFEDEFTEYKRISQASNDYDYDFISYHRKDNEKK